MNPSPRRKILYGVHGYGRGHAARAQAILPHLLERYDVRVLAGDDAYDQLSREYPVTRIPTLRYYARSNGDRSALRTIRRNLPGLLDMSLRGPAFGMICDEVRRFGPDVVLSDSEGWTHRAGRELGIPRISFDHYGILAYCRLPLSRRDRMTAAAESLFYRRLVCRPERIIVVAFFEGEPKREGVRVVGPLLRREVLDTEPRRGEYLMAYFTNAPANYRPSVERALKGLNVPVKIYGPGRSDTDGNLQYRPTANRPFVEDLAGCRAILTTAGNQAISECVHFGKPVFALPEQALEQRLNAQMIERWGAGMQARPRELTSELLQRFLDGGDEFAARIARHRRNGLQEALAAIDEAVEALCVDG